MISLLGKWYDGRTSAEAAAVFTVYDNGAVTVTCSQDAHRILSLPRFSVKISSRLANTPRYLYFPEGQKFETHDNDSVDQVVKRFTGSRGGNLLHRLETHWRFVAICLAVMLLVLWGGITYGVPAAARVIAEQLPPSILQTTGKQTLDLLDRSVLSPSELKENVRNRLQDHFRPIIASHPDENLTVLFRKGGAMGPNAFALPNGTIVFTDEMVLLAVHDDELSAVLTHEIGHVVHRHGLRALIQDSLLSFALLAITGDVSGSSELFLGLPVMLTRLAYSRSFEREADRYALAYLKTHEIPPAHFANLMRRIDKAVSPGGTAESESEWPGYLSSHPLTPDRIRPFEEATR